MGVVHWIYPGASHSRFEHTLGVLHQAQQLIVSINQASGTSPANSPIDSSRAQLVRLCALVHDIGHGVFSHVSEHSLVRRTDLRLALAEFATDKGIDKVQLSELIAHDIVGAPAFIEMISVALDRIEHPLRYGVGAKETAQHVCSLIQKAIVGHHIDDQVPLLHEIITGPFDADKLDYYVRDAHHAGVPSLLDISRLLQKIVTKTVPMKDVPGDIKRALKGGRDNCDLFGLKWSGAAILDELHLARVLLYAKIYRQKKVLAVEAMIDAIFEALGTVDGVSPLNLIELCYKISDDQFIVSEASAIFEAASIKPSSPGLFNFVGGTLRRLRDRDLFVTSLALLEKYPDDPWQSDKKQVLGLTTLAADCENTQKRGELRQGIASELALLAGVLPDAIDDVPTNTLQYGVVISAKPRLSGGTEIDRALILQNNKFIRGRDLDRINQPAWADAYNFGSPQAHIFAPRETALATFVAAERYIRTKYNAVLPRSAIELSKQNSSDVTALKRRLEAVGWYKGIPIDIRPIPARLEMADVFDRVEALAIKLETIDEPVGTTIPRRAPKMRDRILDWLKQFRHDESIERALSMLESLKILSREDNFEALRTFIDKYPQFKGATIIPLGDLKDSGTVQAYISRDLESVFPRTLTVEQAAERGGDEPLVFIDDLIGSGGQASDLIGSWFDNEQLKQEQLGENRLPFNAREQDFLKSRPVAFVFLTGWTDGRRRLQEAADAVGMNAVVYVHIDEGKLPFAFKNIEDGSPQARFRDQCRQIGAALLESNGKDAGKQRDRALGYGNRAMLLATRLNVPTQTLTCIWMDGRYNGVDWHALIRRRKKN
ncbi:phosphoribosyltransferase-like protein [Methylobacterium terrae]|uniref:phosphoribosyltransferase-like protein n=1 Tax=Methylobacterium terrae TaxID=2202827 RepID=UPI0013A54CD0|nr:HD domain-containing protein [Methylobacterium terrae]